MGNPLSSPLIIPPSALLYLNQLKTWLFSSYSAPVRPCSKLQVIRSGKFPPVWKIETSALRAEQTGAPLASPPHLPLQNPLLHDMAASELPEVKYQPTECSLSALQCILMFHPLHSSHFKGNKTTIP